VTQRTAQLRNLHTNARSVGSRQEELGATALLESYSLAAMTETGGTNPAAGARLSMAAGR